MKNLLLLFFVCFAQLSYGSGISSGGGGGAWGSITGTLSDQTDLQTELNAKANDGANSDITSMTGVSGGIASPDFVTFENQASVSNPVAGQTKAFIHSTDGFPYWRDSSGGSVTFVNMSTSQTVGGTKYFTNAPVLTSLTASRNLLTSVSKVVSSGTWAEGANGEWGYQNYSSAKGSATVPLVDLSPGGSTGTGLYTNAQKDLLFTAGGNLTAGIDPFGDFFIYESGAPSRYVYNYTQAAGTQWVPASGVSGVYTFRGKDNSSQQKLKLADSSANNIWEIEAYGSGSSSTNVWIMNNGDSGRAMAGTKAGIGMGNDIVGKHNRLTVVPNADLTGIRSSCTTTVNASTTVSGSAQCRFTLDLGIGDYISVSSASSTYVKVTAIASDTSLTVGTAIGNGSTQTINKKQSPFRVASADLATTYFQVDPYGRVGVNSASNGSSGTATCNGTSGVTVNNTLVTASSIILLSYSDPAGTPTVAPFISAKTAATSFVIKCTAGDTTSTVGYVIFEPF